MATSFYCRQCGTWMPEKGPFCPACGASQSSINLTPTSLPHSDPVNRGTGRMPAGQMLRQRYRLLQTVGRGGMGAVYLAQDTQLGDRLVAVKEMSMSRLSPQDLPRAVEQFRHEAHLLASLHHPNLPIIYEYFNGEDRWYVVMSFVEGVTLQGALEAAPGRRLPAKESVRIGLELCEVLNYLHSHQPQVVFRDLKPSNIMITPQGTIYLIDFGIARHFKQEQIKDTASYYSVGYAPPEQYGQAQTSPRSDIYSLGATLHQMLSGHNPASKPFQFPNLHLIDPTLPGSLARLIAHMLEMNEQRRPTSMAEVKAQLEKVQQADLLAATVQADSTPDGKAKAAKSDASQPNKASAAQASPAQVDVPGAQAEQSRPGLWSQVDGFLRKRRVMAWFCFIALSLVMVWPISWNIMSNDFNSTSITSVWQSAGLWFFVSSAGAAIVGVIFLSARGRSWVALLGGAALTLFGDLALFAFLSGSVYNPSIDQSSWLTVWRDFFRSYASPVLLFSALLLLVGTRCVLRKANVKGGATFGVFLIVAGTAVALIIQQRFDTNSYTSPVPLTTLIWLLSITLGLNIIFISRKQRNRDSKQARQGVGPVSASAQQE
jgi:serine/threonine protein kinase